MRFHRLIAVVCVALLAASCSSKGASSSGSDDAKSQLSGALTNAGPRDASTFAITLDSDVDSLTAVSEGDLTDDQAQMILDSSITISGKQADDPADATSQIMVNVAGSDAIELRVVDDSLYLRADVKGLFDTFGGDTAALDQLIQQAQTMGLDWAQAAIDGKWIVIKGLSELGQQLGGGTQTTAPPQIDQQKVITDLANDVGDNATVTDEGEVDGATHLVAKVPLRETVQDIFNDLGPASETLQGMGGDLSDIPNEDLTVDFYVDGDNLQRISLDLLQLGKLSGTPAPAGADHFALDIALSDFSGTVDPVDEAIEVDAAGIFQALFGGLSGSSDSSGGGGFDCDQLIGAPKQVIDLYKKECPDLQK